MQFTRIARALVIALALAGCAGCDGDDVSFGPEAGTDATTFDVQNDVSLDAHADADDASAVDASDASDASDDAPIVVNGCTSFVDGGTTPIVTFPTDSLPVQYAPSCIQIAAGQSVTFNGSFPDHPLDPFSGDSPNPIQSTSSGTTASFVFPAAGTFGFHCAFHPGIMFGAVLVQ